MNFQIAQVIPSFTPSPSHNLQDLNPRKLIEKLLDIGYKRILLSGAMLDQFNDGIYLWVDDDVDMLLDCYLYLEQIILLKKPYKHFSSLGDGLLTIGSESNTEITKVTLEYCPGLDVANLVTHTITVAADEYVWWWRSIVYEILNLVYSGKQMNLTQCRQ
ncbi:hypothetical protein [Nostoc sp.]|uniref:hypothetical protein n=1 Tax=Nostoc sp. TaxID=1180 RepID=UPI002FFAC220